MQQQGYPPQCQGVPHVVLHAGVIDRQTGWVENATQAVGAKGSQGYRRKRARRSNEKKNPIHEARPEIEWKQTGHYVSGNETIEISAMSFLSPSAAPDCRHPRGKALVIDDEPTTRLLLKTLLEKQGFLSFQAADGTAGIAAFQREAPDIVFVDVIMPGLDGYETAHRIKELAGDRFVPLIFLTGLTDDRSLAKCIEAGGDDFLSKPISPLLLQAKIAAAERTSHLYQTITHQNHQLLLEQELAKHVYAKTIMANPVQADLLQNLQRPASVFCGDILLVERSPTGALHVLVGDFTGHGLSAAIGALPAADVFRGMTAKGFTASEILAELNRKLRQTLPTGMFLAAVFVSIDPDGRFAQVRNSGLPDVYILDKKSGAIRLRIPSSSIPLGISSSLGNMDLQWIEVEPGEQVVVVTDGIVEARNPQGEFYGEARLEECLQRGEASAACRRLTADLDEFVTGALQEDDLTLAVIPCRAERTDSLAKTAMPETSEPMEMAAVFRDADWCWNLEMRPSLLKRTDTIPLLVSTLVDMQGLQAQRQILFTILSELFTNALDHGLLRLDSKLKNHTDGFAGYFRAREERLAQLECGWIRMAFQVKTEDRQGYPHHGHLSIRVEDSGPGFEFEHWQANLSNVRQLSGRGIGLVRELSHSVQFKERGNVVEVIYRW